MLRLSGITKSYGQRRVLEDVSLEVRRGELLGYVGGNGAGKTTSMRIVLGVTEPDSGSVTVDGEGVTAAHRARMGYMPEERGLYDTMRLHQQLAYFAELHGVDRRTAARSADYWLDRLGLHERRDNRLEDLSLGNQQRVQLAAALVHAPDVLVLDEPFSGLDPLAVDVMAEVLRDEAGRGVPVVFSSHQLDLVERLCDRVCVLKDGRVVAAGTVAELTGDERQQHLLRTTAPESAWAYLATDIDHRTDGTVVTLAPTARLDDLVDAVRAAGELHELRPWRPSLTDVYRDVAAPAAGAATPTGTSPTGTTSTEKEQAA
ncbi:ATP-binding cassette domain-containing protein [Nocardioides zeae]|uniref:ATP-binding cassette domain-containing protein n=1 Tax=Nocardioides imazamoxiresistens TaxID=3231893 RepID=A0ABU3PV88_9ACTN|nr:ATP-binding cassette domain-containing protein [Nocardioides zeae]MDT9593119.1 ATP-binding cassette domain-containing protein [Nocardioides zeae]